MQLTPVGHLSDTTKFDLYVTTDDADVRKCSGCNSLVCWQEPPCGDENRREETECCLRFVLRPYSRFVHGLSGHLDMVVYPEGSGGLPEAGLFL